MGDIHFANIVKSFFLGVFLGLVLLAYNRPDVPADYQVLTVLASGSIGFLVGLVTEWLTSKLPIRMARARTYFFINNGIALFVTTIIMAALSFGTGHAMGERGEFGSVLVLVLGIICLANIFDYLMYRRAQRKLKRFQSTLEGIKREGTD